MIAALPANATAAQAAAVGVTTEAQQSSTSVDGESRFTDLAMIA